MMMTILKRQESNDTKWQEHHGSNQLLSDWIYVQHQRWNPYLEPLLGQESMTRQVIDPTGQTSTIILLNGHSS